MMLRKWNYKTNVYDHYEIPNDWNVSIFETDMGTTINCAECGKRISFGEGYTSRKIHSFSGMGYSVCKDCYDKEIEEELRILRRRNHGR